MPVVVLDGNTKHPFGFLFVLGICGRVDSMEVKTFWETLSLCPMASSWLLSHIWCWGVKKGIQNSKRPQWVPSSPTCFSCFVRPHKISIWHCRRQPDANLKKKIQKVFLKNTIHVIALDVSLLNTVLHSLSDVTLLSLYEGWLSPYWSQQPVGFAPMGPQVSSHLMKIECLQ